MAKNIFRGRVDAHAAFNAYNANFKKFSHPVPSPIPISEGYNVDGWTVDSSGQIFHYDIHHNLNLADPGRLVVQLKYVYSYSTSDFVIARLSQSFRNNFVAQTYGIRGPSAKIDSFYEAPASFIFEAELH